MNCQIIFDRPGRLRLRLGPAAFTQEEGFSIASLLSRIPGVTNVKTASVNGGILVLYSRHHVREQILNAVNTLSLHSLPKNDLRPEDHLMKIDQSFQNTLVDLAVRRFFFRCFLPAPLRGTVTLCKAARHIRTGFSCLRRGKLTVDVLDAAAVSAAFFQKNFATAGTILFLLKLSGILEDYTKQRARTALTQSLSVRIDQVWVFEEDRLIQKPLHAVKIGDRVCVRTGSMIPLDGIVATGEALVNESAMTGEPLPTLKRTGASVYAGTVIQEGSLVIRVTALSSDTRIQKIIQLIDDSENRKAKVQSRAEHLADSIVPFSFIASLGVYLLTGNLTKALSVLMVDYSCAIKLSTPISVISAMREAASNGFVIKGGKYLEAFAGADTIVFDKTGTLTSACPNVAKVIPLGAYSRQEVLKTAACLEEHFPHSVARAIVQKAADEGLRHEEEHADVEYVVAHGISSFLHGKRVLIGSGHFIFEDEGISLSEEQRRIIRQETEGCSVIYLSIGDELAGFLCIDDPPRETASHAIAMLKESGIENVIMLTGDSEGAAKAVSETLGITSYQAQVLPEEKSSVIRDLKKKGHTLIMAGDGINDSPALAAADVSVSMKDSSDIARETADITLLSSDLTRLAVLRRLSTALFQKINWNYRIIVSFNTLLLALGVGGVISPSASAFLHNVSTIAISAKSMQPCLKKQ